MAAATDIDPDLVAKWPIAAPNDRRAAPKKKISRNAAAALAAGAQRPPRDPHHRLRHDRQHRRLQAKNSLDHARRPIAAHKSAEAP
jgi:hypothetical protein